MARKASTESEKPAIYCIYDFCGVELTGFVKVA
jgi:hypothetical protein